MWGGKAGWLVLIVLLGAGCATKKKQRPPRFMYPRPPMGAATTPAPAAPAPTSAVVVLHGVLISPGKATGSAWDFPGGDVSNALNAVGNALMTVNPEAAVATILAGPLCKGLERPEVFGTVSLVTWQGPAGTQKVWSQRDTFTPQFVPQPRFQVDLQGESRVEVHLFDEDLEAHDPIGQFQIGVQEVRRAMSAGKIVSVPVHAQTNRQVLFVQISAMSAH